VSTFICLEIVAAQVKTNSSFDIIANR